MPDERIMKEKWEKYEKAIMVKSTNNARWEKYERKMRKGVKVKRRDREKGKREGDTHKVVKPENDNHSHFTQRL